MCGIAGLVNLRPDLPPSRRMLAAMAGALGHRGPDECGLYRDAHAGLAHTRLSVIDLATGQQPLSIEDGALWIVFNGEIFNYPELRQTLEARGRRFRTRSDTEVLLAAYHEWGDGAFARLNGQWAAAIWDSKRRRLVLTRDRLGIRPLYYAELDGRVAFASEVKAIFAGAPELPRELDPAGIDDTFTFWTRVSPRTPFSGVFELEPGYVRTYEGAQCTQRAFWKLRYPERDEVAFSGRFGEAREAVEAELTRATSLRMLRADVPVGCYLSGGLDSSLVTALGARARGDTVHTFSVRFDDAEYDETCYQRAVAAALGSTHHELRVSGRDIADAFPEVVRHGERPILRTAPAPLYLLSKLVRDVGIKVVLTGEGADEMFAGYDLFREGAVRRFWARRPESQVRPLLLERLYPYLTRSPVAQRAMARRFFGRDLDRWRDPGFAHGPRWRTTAALKRLLSSDMRAAAGGRDAAAELVATLPQEFGRWSFLAQDQYLEIRTLLSGYLLSAQGDRMLMAHSVEGRFPFLDPDVVELANTLPDAYKLAGLDEKHVLKRVAVRYVPEAIARRTKQPYRAPDALAFFGPDAPDWISTVLSEDAVRRAGVFQPRSVELLWRKCQRLARLGQLSNTDNMALVAVLSTQLLWEELVRREPSRQPPAIVSRFIDRVSP